MLSGIWEHHSVPLEHSMIKSRFNGTLNDIWTYCSTINQTLVVFSKVFDNLVQYEPLDPSVVKYYFSGTLIGI